MEALAAAAEAESQQRVPPPTHNPTADRSTNGTASSTGVKTLTGSSKAGAGPKPTDDTHAALRNRKRRTRTVTTPYQARVLNYVLMQTSFPSTEQREQLAKRLGMTPRTVQVWFQNQRQKAKNRRVTPQQLQVLERKAPGVEGYLASLPLEARGSMPSAQSRTPLHLDIASVDSMLYNVPSYQPPHTASAFADPRSPLAQVAGQGALTHPTPSDLYAPPGAQLGSNLGLPPTPMFDPHSMSFAPEEITAPAQSQSLRDAQYYWNYLDKDPQFSVAAEEAQSNQSSRPKAKNARRDLTLTPMAPLPTHRRQSSRPALPAVATRSSGPLPYSPPSNPPSATAQLPPPTTELGAYHRPMQRSTNSTAAVDSDSSLSSGSPSPNLSNLLPLPDHPSFSALPPTRSRIPGSAVPKLALDQYPSSVRLPPLRSLTQSLDAHASSPRWPASSAAPAQQLPPSSSRPYGMAPTLPSLTPTKRSFQEYSEGPVHSNPVPSPEQPSATKSWRPW
ncbi:hypothetical protein H4R35_005614 [Dimargaris xerosporica]|nr:hypothetical protein H4R35_005614 [Dimargaris xerosporica]